MPEYTDPKLRSRLKARIQRSSKGGKPGQWSARKAQLLAQAYKKEGGGYGRGKDDTQKSLDRWGAQKWTTTDGKRARRSGGTTRYLPEKAWKALTPDEKKATQKAKQAGSRRGDQFVANTPAAKRARAKIARATHGAAGKKKAKKKAAPRKRAARKATTTRKKTAGRKTPAARKKTARRKTPAARKKAAGRKTPAARKETVRRRASAARRKAPGGRAPGTRKKAPARRKR